MDYTQKVNTGTVAGFLIGALCLSFILYFLVSEERKIANPYYVDLNSLNESVK